MMLRPLLSAVFACCLLAACGGGNGPGGPLISPEPTPASVVRAATQRAVPVNATVSHYFTTAGQDAGRARAFRTAACDFGEHSNSTPWFNGGYPKQGQQIFIPDAKDTRLPDGSRHQGFFTCAQAFPSLDRGSVAIYVGEVANARAASRATPFRFARSVPGRSVEVVVFP